MPQFPAGIPKVPVRTPFYDPSGGVSREWMVFLERLPGGPRVIVEEHAKREKFAAANYPGVWYYESDRSVYYFSIGTTWTYAFGEMVGTIDPATADDKPTDLGVIDAGFIFYSTDFDRRFRWTGSAWERAPMEPPRGQFAHFDEDPGVGWVLCNGTAAKRTKADGTVEDFTPPDLTGGTYLKGAAAYSGTPDPAVAPGITGSTAAAGGHDHDVDINHDHPAFNAPTGSVAAGAGVPSSFVVNPIDVPALGSTLRATTSEPDHTHGAGTLAVSDTGRPPSLGALPYYRA